MYNRNPVVMSSTTSELLRFSYGILPSLKISHISTPRRNGEYSTAIAKVHKEQTNRPMSRNHRPLDIKIQVPTSGPYNIKSQIVSCKI